MSRSRRIGWAVSVVAIGVALAWSLAPVYWMFVTSLKTELEAEPLPTTIEIYRSVVSGRICPSDRIGTDMAAGSARFERERPVAALELRP